MGGWPWLILFYFGRAPTPPGGTTRGFSFTNNVQTPAGQTRNTRVLAQRTLDLQHCSVWILRATHAKEKVRVKT